MSDSESDSGDAIPEFVTLVANDGSEFVIERNAAFVSNTVKAILCGGGMFLS
jgi:hypothetical protein